MTNVVKGESKAASFNLNGAATNPQVTHHLLFSMEDVDSESDHGTVFQFASVRLK